ncbi:MAG TPA: cation:proton antiporter [Micromonospora sp.]
MEWDPADLVITLFGLGALLAGVLPRLVEQRPFSMPIVFVALGMVVFSLPTPLPRPDPLTYPTIAMHLTELGVIIALMGAGLKIDRTMDLCRWMSTWRLVIIAMPLTVAGVAVLGWWWMGLAPVAAVLLGGALAPTDPVLASDVDVGKPTESEDSEDEVRFALTSEGGLTEGLAFLFVYAAIAWATAPEPSLTWLLRWLSVDAAYKAAMGILGGTAVGWLLGRLFFRAPSEKFRLARHSEGFLALASSFLTYGAVELVGGYGFLAVFIAARAIRRAQRRDHYHQVLHDFSEQVERLWTMFLLLLFGGAVANGLFAALTWQAALTGLALLLVIRPLVARFALWGAPGYGPEHWVVAAFGIRGIGTLYYLSHTVAHVVDFPQAKEVWATGAFVVLVSVVVHGITATPVMQTLDRCRRRAETSPGTAL